jgi:hypothetical protein
MGMYAMARTDIEIAEVLRLVVSAVFLVSGVGKAVRLRAFASALERYQLMPTVLLRPVSAAITIAEISVGVLLWASYQVGVGLAFGLVLLFVGVTIVTLRRGLAVPCLCFDPSSTEVMSARNLFRLGAIALALLVVVVSERDVNPPAIDLQGGELLIAMAVLALAFWIFELPDVLALWKPCVECQRHRNQSA